MSNHLKPEERQRIDAALKAVESRTAKQFTLVVAPVSDRYPLYPPLWASLIALTITAIVALARPDLSIRAALVIQLPILIVLTLVLDWMPLRLAVVPSVVKQAHARHLAHREFAAHLAAGPNRVLLFVSLGERYVEILADHATHAMVPEGTWDRIVGDFVTAVKTGRVADGIVVAITACGKVLETHT